MSIRSKLLIFIPLLVLLMNLVTYFLFQSGTIVQDSYDLIMGRILKYKETTGASEDSLKAVYSYLLHPAEDSKEQATRKLTYLSGLHSSLVDTGAAPPLTSSLTGYGNMIRTLLSLEQQTLAAAENGKASEAFGHYLEAERTVSFIRDEGQRLVEGELDHYRPVFRSIQAENARLYKLGVAVFALGTTLSVVVAVWISRSITVPVSALVRSAKSVSRGNLDPDLPAGGKDELAALSGAFTGMLAGLKESIAKDRDIAEKERLVKTLELQALQSQINPHFLYNTLNALSKLALLEEAEQTSDLIVSMSNFMRYNLQNLDRQVPLRNELEHVKEYIRLQQTRFRDRVTFLLDIDEKALDIRVPSLTIQPIIENAFIHGTGHMESGAVISLSVYSGVSATKIVIHDNGIGMTENIRASLLNRTQEPPAEVPLQAPSTGLGTRNVFRRLELVYGRTDLVQIASEPGKGTTVVLNIPAGRSGMSSVSADDSR
ncbi:sensor histidine kinase YesM [Paenibacillus forsythiae]|uniref:histidine kinase n=1 Tax=Paenibacillus forsythiae TaxID=365616 RepID=A0ABU3H263_9BACL|nr:sensor histidine kinase [Paenibacillus forsythiae]MDT3424915.1 sensor histidine kinase YesM [Paenibacillus forsythiae]